MSNYYVCFGEVLWDIFPHTETVGGAPFNVALRLSSFGNDVYMISRIGNDRYGKRLLEFVYGHKIRHEHIITDEHNPTGKVIVTLNHNRNTNYEILHAAWDYITPSPEALEVVKKSKAFIYGTLSCRKATTRDTLLEYLKHAPYRVFDVNLRPPHYRMSVLEHLAQRADIIKLNDEELYDICLTFGSPYYSMGQNIEFLSKKTNTPTICVTKGKHGAVLYYKERFYHNSGYRVAGVDTMGAGDAFLGTLIHYLLKGAGPQKSVDIACGIGALVASREGASPELSVNDIEAFIQKDISIS